MGNHSRKFYEKAATHYLEKVRGRYVFNKSSGLYEAKSERTEKQCEESSAGASRRTPFHVDLRRDWIVIIVSVVSLFLFGITIHYARLQWHEMHESTIQSTRAANTANRAVDIANTALTQSKNQFVQDERPYVWITDNIQLGETSSSDPIAPNRIAVNYDILNYGKSPALNVQMVANIAVGDKAERQTALKAFNKSGGSIMPPTKGANASAISDTPPYPNFHTYGDKHKIVVYGRIRYNDLYGNVYISDWCLAYVGAIHPSNCPDRNRMK